ncbi:hypothetical protein LTS18_013352, partial [Coniosporium uncinatum]
FHALVTKQGLDGFLMPSYQATAVPHDKYGLPIYTVLPNLLNYPAVAIPYLKANEEADREFVKEGVEYEPEYKPEEVEGAPCGLQLVGKAAMRDEELVEVLKVVGKALGMQ